MAKERKKSAKTPLLVWCMLLIIVFAGFVYFILVKTLSHGMNYVDDSEVTNELHGY